MNSEITTSEFCLRSENIQSVEKSTNGFQWQDFVVFGVVLSISAVIGILFGFRDRNKSSKEYMLGGGNVAPIPVAMSLATTFISSITILSTPGEYANYGTMYNYIIVTYIIITTLSVEVFAPMYKEFGLTSLYEYLEIRYNWRVRYLATTEFIIQNIMYCGMVIYMPSVALETVTGLDKYAAIWLTGGVCVFYTSIGGLKAVVWTDTFQILIMMSGFMAIIVKGSMDHGGISNIYQSYSDANRIVWKDFQFDHRYRHTFWSITIGNVLGGMGNNFCTSQGFFQRLAACKDHRNMRIAAYSALCFICVIFMLTFVTGMVLFKYNECCNPYKAGWVDASDQLVPYLTAIIFENTPGIAGIYVSAAFSGTLSTVSSMINSMSTVFVTDFIRPNEKRIFGNMKTDLFYTSLGKRLCLLFGLCCIGFAYIAANLGGSMLQASVSIISIIAGPTFAIFLLAFFNPWSEAIGVFVGFGVGNAAALWFYIGSTQYPSLPQFTKLLPSEIIGCKGLFNCTAETTGEPWCNSSLEPDQTPMANFYTMSYLYLGTLGLVMAFSVGSIVSCIVCHITNKSPNDLPPRVLFPPIDKMFPRNENKNQDKKTLLLKGCIIKKGVYRL